jgi:dihydrofolate reductase
MISIIAIIGKNRELGRDNHLLWNIPSDLKRFREITKGHPVIMGRKTFESIGHPLPNRKNIVISHHGPIPGVSVVGSFDEAIEQVKGTDEIFVIGGGQIYAAAIEKSDRLYLTIVDADAPDADTFFPNYSPFTKVIETSDQEENGIRFTYLILEK